LSRILKVILFIIFFAVFFEAGLISSYTIVTSQPPDVAKLLEMQVEEISSLLNLGTPGSSTLVPNQQVVKILNPDEVAEALKGRTQMSGINLQTMSASTFDSTKNKNTNITVNITATGYKEAVTGANVTGGTIVITPNETYTITATAVAEVKTGGVQVNILNIQITSLRKLYGSTG